MQLWPPCNTVRSGHFYICNRVRAMQKPSGGHVHVHHCTCMSVRKRACMHWTYVGLYAAWIFTYFMIAANAQRPNISHVIHDTHLACKKNGERFCLSAFNLLEGRFCTGADTTAYAKPSGEHYCICSNVFQIVLHRVHNCMRHRPSIRTSPFLRCLVHHVQSVM